MVWPEFEKKQQSMSHFDWLHARSFLSDEHSVSQVLISRSFKDVISVDRNLNVFDPKWKCKTHFYGWLLFSFVSNSRTDLITVGALTNGLTFCQFRAHYFVIAPLGDSSEYCDAFSHRIENSNWKWYWWLGFAISRWKFQIGKSPGKSNFPIGNLGKSGNIYVLVLKFFFFRTLGTRYLYWNHF